MNKIIALLDANVLYPAPVRDILLYIASEGGFEPKWTSAIHEEWVRNLLKNRPELNKTSLEKAISAMNLAFPEADVSGYEELMDALELPDKDDHHVLAAALYSGANFLLTFNLKDFPSKSILKYPVKVIHPDDFIVQILSEDTALVKSAFKKQVLNLKNPQKTKKEVLEILTKCDLKKAAELLQSSNH